jgi:predicted GNAT superfamily acetyltransferase
MKEIHLKQKLDGHGEITIRKAESIADYHACRNAQRRAWGIVDDCYLVPVATMIGANLHGGLVLGAFLPGGEAIAMSFAFLGRIRGRICLYSQLTGVVPEYQSRGLGCQIKLFQRDFARAQGIGLVAWAFDPLQAGNAHFNLTRLGATARRYVENMYGERTDTLNVGVPTDRLIAEWETFGASAVAVPPDSVATLPRLIQTHPLPPDERGSPTAFAPSGSKLAGEAPRVLLEIPNDITRFRREHAALAEPWRLAVRQAFRMAFDAGYRAVAFVRDDASGPRRGFYLLDREHPAADDDEKTAE